MTKYFLFLAVLLIPVSSVYAQQPQNNTITIAPANETIAAGPNTTVLFSANSTGFDPLSQLGTLMMVGQVLNNGTEPSENTNVTTELLDMNGTLIGFNTVTTVPSTIPPNQTANFQTKFSDQDVIGGTGNAFFYQNTPDNGGDTGKFLGFIPPPFFFGGAAALMQAGVPLGSGGGFATGGGAGGGGGFIGGGGGGGSGGDSGSGGGGTTINNINRIINCIQNQANEANNVNGEVGQINFAVCGEGNIIQQPVSTTPTTPAAGTPGGAPKDGKCDDGQKPVDNKCPPALKEKPIALGEPGSVPKDGKCNDGQTPVDNKCPATQKPNQITPGKPGGAPVNGKCDDGQTPVDNRCPAAQTQTQTPQQLAALRAQLDAQQLQSQAAVPQEDDPCLSDDPPDDCPSTDGQQRNALQQDNTASQDQSVDDPTQSQQQATVDNPTQDDEGEDDEE